MILIGIDPGLTGAICTYQVESEELICGHMPVVKAKEKSELDLQTIIQTFKACTDQPCYAALELVHAMPGNGVSSMFRFGKGFGMIQGILATLNIQYDLITPQCWMKNVPEKGLGKVGVVTTAKRLYPQLEIKLVKEYPFADAVMIMHQLRLLYLSLDKLAGKE